MRIVNDASEPGELTNCQRRGDKSGQRKKANDEEAPTSCHREGPVTTAKENQRARGTHELSGPNGWRGQVRRAKASERATYVLSRKAEGQSGERMKANGKGALTLCRAQTEERVGTAKESQPARGTHELSNSGSDNIRTAKESRQARGTHVQALSSTEGGTT
jgi:hypothetical protein